MDPLAIHQAIIESINGAYYAQKARLTAAHNETVAGLEKDKRVLQNIIVSRCVQLRRFTSDEENFNSAEEQAYYQGLAPTRLQTEVAHLERLAATKESASQQLSTKAAEAEAPGEEQGESEFKFGKATLEVR